MFVRQISYWKNKKRAKKRKKWRSNNVCEAAWVVSY